MISSTATTDMEGSWIKNYCVEIESLQEKGDSFVLHKKVKEISHIYKKHQTNHIKNEPDELIKTQEDLAKP